MIKSAIKFIILFFVFALLLSPLISLILPIKLTNHTYSRLVFDNIVEHKTKGCKNDEEKAIALFNFIVDREFLQGTPHKCKPLDSLIYREAYCDFQARSLNALLGVAGIKSRYAMLLNKDGNSPHTLNEVYLNGDWRIFDPTFDHIPRDKNGNILTLETISSNFDIIYEDKRFQEFKKYSSTEYENYLNFYKSVFPMPFPPRRSTPTVSQAHIIDYITDLYFKIFKNSFFNFYQDIYLKTKLKTTEPEDYRLFYRGRNYQLGFRYKEALKCYFELFSKYPQSKYYQDALFSQGILYFKSNEYENAEKTFKYILKAGQGKWIIPTYYYLGKTYWAEGRKDDSLKDFYNADITKLSAEILAELNNNGYKRK